MTESSNLFNFRYKDNQTIIDEAKKVSLAKRVKSATLSVNG